MLSSVVAVGMHGHPRATKDIDFLVGDEAFESTSPIVVYRQELEEIARAGVIDLMSVPRKHNELRNLLALPQGGELPLIPAPALVLLKLSAGRPQDLADVHALLKAGVDASEVRDYLANHAPEFVPDLARLIE